MTNLYYRQLHKIQMGVTGRKLARRASQGKRKKVKGKSCDHEGE